jgi:hypothetical protein
MAQTARQRGLDKNKKEHDYEKRRSLQSKRPKQKDGETLKAYRARLERWASKYDIGKRVLDSLSGGGNSKNTRTQFPSNAKGNERLRSEDKKVAPKTPPKTPPTPQTPPKTPPKTPPTPQTTAADKPNPLPKKQTTQEVKKAGNDPMMVWAKANAKMIEKSGTKKQKELLRRYKKHGLKKASSSLKVNAKNDMDKYSGVKRGDYGNAGR